MHKTAHNKTGSQIPSRRNSTASQNAAAECRSTERRWLTRISPLHRRLRRSEEHTSELQSQSNLVCRLLLEKKKNNTNQSNHITFEKVYHPALVQNTSFETIIRLSTNGPSYCTMQEPGWHDRQCATYDPV